MPALPFVPNVIKVRLAGNFSTGGNWAVLDYWRYAGSAPSNADISTFASGVSTAYGAHLVGQFGNGTFLRSVECQDLTSATAAVGADGTLRPGTGGSTIVPVSVCVLESKLGRLRYRGGHSRTYWPPLAPAGSMADGADWNGTQLSNFGTALSGYLNAIISVGAGLSMGPIQRSIVHYSPKNPIPGITYPYVEDVASNSIESRFASQRRRLAR